MKANFKRLWFFTIFVCSILWFFIGSPALVSTPNTFLVVLGFISAFCAFLVTGWSAVSFFKIKGE